MSRDYYYYYPALCTQPAEIHVAVTSVGTGLVHVVQLLFRGALAWLPWLCLQSILFSPWQQLSKTHHYCHPYQTTPAALFFQPNIPGLKLGIQPCCNTLAHRIANSGYDKQRLSPLLFEICQNSEKAVQYVWPTVQVFHIFTRVVVVAKFPRTKCPRPPNPRYQPAHWQCSATKIMQAACKTTDEQEHPYLLTGLRRSGLSGNLTSQIHKYIYLYISLSKRQPVLVRYISIYQPPYFLTCPFLLYI